MKLWKKILLIIIGVVLLTQAPFIYQRFQKRALNQRITELKSQHTAPANADYKEYTGVIHVHTVLGEHSTGGFNELLTGAQKNELDFVILTEHSTPFYDTSAMTFKGFQEGILFVPGNELDTENQDRFLLLPGSADAEEMTRESTNDFLGIMQSQEKLAFVTYPESFKTWDAPFDGIEVFNMNTNSKQINWAWFAFDALWSFGAYPELTMATYLKRPEDNLRKFDEIAARRKISLVGGSDAHSNIGFHLLGDDTGKKFIDIKLDRYETAFRMVRQHIFLDNNVALSQESVLSALKAGHSYIAFDVLSNARGFFFSASSIEENVLMGDEISLEEGSHVNLQAVSPLSARFVLFKDGQRAAFWGSAKEFEFAAKERGVYRVEVYLDTLGAPFDKMPWIISNPIYVK